LILPNEDRLLNPGEEGGFCSISLEFIDGYLHKPTPTFLCDR
jgi:hypothetical protein